MRYRSFSGRGVSGSLDRTIRWHLVGCVAVLGATAACTGTNCGDTRSCGASTGTDAGGKPSTGGGGTGGGVTGASGTTAAGDGARGGSGPEAGNGNTDASSGGEGNGGSGGGLDGKVASEPDAGPTGNTEAGTETPDGGPEVIIPCLKSRGNCDKDPTNGCETDLTIDPDDCGGCGQSCSATGTVTRACVSGTCTPTCDATHLDCDRNGATGCEVSTTDPNHCGTCDHACSAAGTASLACTKGVCKPTCDSTHEDCNGLGDDGCEIDTDNDPNNCGACGHACSLAGATDRACVQGVCKPTCSGNTGDCETPPATSDDDGCETNLVANPANCGGCGRNCLGGACSASSCESTTLAAGLSDFDEVFTVDSAYVHWIDTTEDSMGNETSTIVRVSLSGSSRTTVSSSEPVPGTAITSDGTYVYWAGESTSPSSSTPNGVIRRVTSGKTDVQTLVTAVNPSAIAADGKYVYWLDADDKLHRVGRDGTGATTISPAFSGPNALIVDSTSAYVSFGSGATAGIARVPTSGTGAITETAPETASMFIVTFTLAEDTSHLYTFYYSNSQLQIAQLAKTLSGSPKVMVIPLADAFAVDSKFLYYPQSDGLYRMPIAGGAATFVTPTVASGASFEQIVTTPTALYWLEIGDASRTLARVAIFEN